MFETTPLFTQLTHMCKYAKSVMDLVTIVDQFSNYIWDQNETVPNIKSPVLMHSKGFMWQLVVKGQLT